MHDGPNPSDEKDESHQPHHEQCDEALLGFVHLETRDGGSDAREKHVEHQTSDGEGLFHRYQRVIVCFFDEFGKVGELLVRHRQLILRHSVTDFWGDRPFTNCFNVTTAGGSPESVESALGGF